MLQGHIVDIIKCREGTGVDKGLERALQAIDLLLNPPLLYQPLSVSFQQTESTGVVGNYHGALPELEECMLLGAPHYL